MGKGKGKKKSHVSKAQAEHEQQAQTALSSKSSEIKIPKSVVFRHGKVESELLELMYDLRKLLAPNTASSLRDATKLNLKDYSHALGSAMGVSHLFCLRQSKKHMSLRIAKATSGPTLSFHIQKFTLMKQVRSIQRRPLEAKEMYLTAPIVVTNNFTAEGGGDDALTPPQVKLMRITFQSTFPAINIANVKLNDCRRVVLFHYLPKEDLVEMRHYAIRATPVGIGRKVKKIVFSNNTKLPNLHKYKDVSDYILGNMSSGASEASDSEAEDEANQVILPQEYKHNSSQSKSALKLVEIGPRLTLKLFKVQKELGKGEVMYHGYEQKSAGEVKTLKDKKEMEGITKKRRREEQEANVARKTEKKEEKDEGKKKRKLERDTLALNALKAEAGMSVVEKDEESEDESID